MTNRETYRRRILRVLGHIQRHLDEELSLGALAEIARFSPFHFHRIFSGMVGESVMAHVRRLRLERAAHQLMHTERPVIDVALDAGYETQESFTRSFRTTFGDPPGRFRRTKRSAARAPTPSNVHYDPEASAGGFTPLREGTEAMEVRVEHREPAKAVYLRHVGPYEEVGEVWEELCGLAASEGLMSPDCTFFGLSYDDPAITPPEKLRYDACLSVAEGAEVTPPLAVQDTPEGAFAVTIHEGPYEELGRTYEAVMGGWLPGSGREPRPGPCLELYLNDPNVTEPEDFLTEVWIPVTKEKSR